MFKKIANLFKSIQRKPIELLFYVDTADINHYVIRLVKKYPDGSRKNARANEFMQYGYIEIEEQDGQQTIYVLDNRSYQTILAIKSLNPVLHDDGSLVVDVDPTILQYLRKKMVIESIDAKKIRVADKPAIPTVIVKYNPKHGLDVTSGYQVTREDELVPVSDITTTRDGQYMHIGDVFTPIPQISELSKKILDQQYARIETEDIPEFFLRDMVLIKKEFNAVLTDLADQVQVITDPLQAVVNVNKDKKGWLDFNVSYNVHGYSLPADILLKAQEAKQDYVQIDDQTWVKVDKKVLNQTKAKLNELGADITENGYRMPVSEFASLEDFIASIGGRAVMDQAYKEFLDQLSGFTPNPEYILPKNFEDHLIKQGLQLRPYQRAGIHWLDWLRSNHLHGVLADDMGLGKTIQALSILRVAYENDASSQHCLVVTPKSVLHHWDREIQRVFTYIRTYIYHGPARSQKFFQSSMPYIFITTYDTVVKDQEILSRIPFLYLILDEATRIKNPDARRSQAIKSLNASHRLALSGTPVENRPVELWSLFDFLMRGHLGKHGTFVQKYENGILSGDAQSMHRLGRRVKPFLLRRKKEEVAKDLPEKIVIKEWVDLTVEQRDLYGGLQDQVKLLRMALQKGDHVNYTTSILPVITKLKQICDHPALITGIATPEEGRSEKFDWILEKITEIVEEKEQVVIFSHFLKMLSLLESSLSKKGIPYIRIDGSTNQRQPLIDAFNQGRASVALLSIAATGYGINMTAANHVIHADRWWNPAVEDQATDRVHRIGQNKTVFVYHILTQGTLEEKIDVLLNRKRGMADEIIGAASEGEHRWTREELLELLKPLD